MLTFCYLGTMILLRTLQESSPVCLGRYHPINHELMGNLPLELVFSQHTHTLTLTCRSQRALLKFLLLTGLV